MLLTFLLPETNLKKQMCSSWAFHVDARFESSNTYDMIIGNNPKSSWRIRHNHDLQWPDGHFAILKLFQWRTVIQHFIISRSPDWVLYERKWTINAERWIFWGRQILDTEYKPASLDDVIKTCGNLHVEEQHEFKYHSKNRNFFDITSMLRNSIYSKNHSKNRNFTDLIKRILGYWIYKCNQSRKL
jgi:hypothetical protein